jgi:hypothetical protein
MRLNKSAYYDFNKEKTFTTVFIHQMTINRDFFGSFSSYIRIGLTGFVIITVVVLSLIPIYIKDRSVEVPLSTPTGQIDNFRLPE